MEEKKKVKKEKKHFTEMSTHICQCGCKRAIKQNVIDRVPYARLCYLGYLKSIGRSHVFTGSVEQINLDGTKRRVPVFQKITELLDKIINKNSN